MKKNLNIAYLNGAEGMIRRGGASSGGSGESGGSGSSLKYLPKYYSIDWSVAEGIWEKTLGGDKMVPFNIAATIKSGSIITPQDPSTPENIEAFSFLPVGFQNQNIYGSAFFETLESVIDFMKTDFEFPISMNGIKEISEEEYYSFDNYID